MRNLSLLVSVVATAVAASAQCTAPTSLITNPPTFSATHYVGSPNPPVVPDPGISSLFDLTVNGAITLNTIDCDLYDFAGSANPDQVGNTGVCTLWIVPGTWVGNELAPANWISLGTGTYTVVNGDSPCVFSTPITLSPGSYGVALQLAPTNAGPLPANFARVHPLVTLPSVAPNTPLSASDQFLSITNETTQRVSFVSGAAANHTINLRLNYTVSPSTAYSSQYGVGCYFRPQSFYEAFPVPPTGFDLANQGMTMINLGNNYQVVPAAPMSPFTPITPEVVGVAGVTFMGDDDVSAPIALPFTFSAPGGVSTSSICIGSNGYVFLSAVAGSAFGYYDDINRFLTDAPRLAIGYGDLQTVDPVALQGTGHIYYDIDPSNTFVTITWDGVQEWNTPTAILNMQMVLYASGQVDFHYGSCTQGVAPLLTGYSVGNGQDPNGRNLSVGGAIVPFLSGDGSSPAVIGTTARPVVGSTFGIRTTGIAPGTFFNLVAMSFGGIPAPGVDLGFIGMPGCKQLVGPAIATSFFGFVAGGSHTQNLSVPNSAGYIGIQLYAQSAPLTAGLNSAGILTSNAVCMHLGN